MGQLIGDCQNIFTQSSAVRPWILAEPKVSAVLHSGMSLNQKLPGTDRTPFRMTAALKCLQYLEPMMAAMQPPQLPPYTYTRYLSRCGLALKVCSIDWMIYLASVLPMEPTDFFINSCPKPEEPEKLGIRIAYPHFSNKYFIKLSIGVAAPWGPPCTRTSKGFFYFLNYSSTTSDSRQKLWMGVVNSQSLNYSLAMGGICTILFSPALKQKKLLQLCPLQTPVTIFCSRSKLVIPQDSPNLFCEMSCSSPVYKLMHLMRYYAFQSVWKYAQGFPSCTNIQDLMVKQLPTKICFSL